MRVDLATGRSVSNEEFALLLARPQTRIMFICLAVGITGLVQGFTSGWGTDVQWLIGGSAGSVVCMFLFGLSLTTRGRSAFAPLAAVAGFGPYLFGSYLLFVRGLWHGRVLLESFSGPALVAVVAFTYLGYRLVYWTWQMSEIGESMRTGRLVVAEESSSA